MYIFLKQLKNSNVSLNLVDRGYFCTYKVSMYKRCETEFSL